MTSEVAASREVIRYEDGRLRTIRDEIVAEWPITLIVNGEEFATLVCSPEYIEDLAVGFLAAEGVLADYGRLTELAYDERTGNVYAEVDGIDSGLLESGSKRYLTSCCGQSRPSFVFYSDARTAKPVRTNSVSLTYGACLRMMGDMQRQSGLFKSTGGVHNAALFEADGRMALSRMDIGRHNALDKIYGHCLRSGAAMTGKVLAFSGRVSSEVLLKAAKMQCEVLLSKSAATGLAVELAEQLGITVVGFIRNNSFNIYSHPERLRPEEGE